MTNTNLSSLYTEIYGDSFENVLNEDGSAYHFHPSWKCTGFKDSNNPRIPAINSDYVFSKDILRDVLVFLMYPRGTALWLTGPTGSGKTTVITQIAARLNWPCIECTLSNRFEFSDLRGQWGLQQPEGSSSPIMQYIYNALPMAMREGYILILNEADLASPGELSALNDVIEGRSLLIAERSGEVIKPHPMFRLVVTGNSAGAGDASGLYQGVQQQNVAAMDRYRMVEIKYPTSGIEEGILRKCVPNVPEELRNAMVKFANEMRSAFQEAGTISVPFSTRTLCHWAETMSFYAGSTCAVKKSLELFFLNKLTEEEREAATTAARLCFGDDVWKE